MAELKELAEFYARASAMKDPVVKFDGRLTGNIGPEISGSITRWTVEERQPDFKCLIDSGIDCEFSDTGRDWAISKLTTIGKDPVFPYVSSNSRYRHCRPRLNHVHAWIATEDSKCPVPEGYLVKLFAFHNDRHEVAEPREVDWSCSNNICRFLAFEVLPK